MHLTGLHHVTAVSAQIAANKKFYTEVLGLRLVKKSVNQDDVSAYHLFYADKAGSPGTDMTFFDWPNIGSDQRGSDTISGTAFRVSGAEALDFWEERLKAHGAENIRRDNFAGRDLITFDDPEGQQLLLVDDQGAAYDGEIWPRPDIPDEFTLRGFYSVVLTVPQADNLSLILTRLLNFTEKEQATWLDGKSEAVIYQSTPEGGPGKEVWLVSAPGMPRGRLGAGGVHHVAFRVPDEASEMAWHDHIARAGLNISPQIDRFWFKSLYFRVSMGILFEIATDGPGFAIDEDPETLGEKLVLPPFLEAHRQQIEAGLKPID